MATAIRTTEGWRANEATERILGRVDWARMPADIDWDDAVVRLTPPPMPDYVRSSIHGIEGGYGNVDAATTWDVVVEQIFAEYAGSEQVARDALPAAITTMPGRILDVACGTGESTLAWRRAFPDAAIVALDVSPYMTAVAEQKLADDRRIEVRCLDAEHLPFPDGSFDLVSAQLLFHELPRHAATRVLGQMSRVCAAGGQIALLEPYRVGEPILDPIPFPEPYLKEFLATDWDAAIREAGFERPRVEPSGAGWIRVATKG